LIIMTKKTTLLAMLIALFLVSCSKRDMAVPITDADNSRSVNPKSIRVSTNSRGTMDPDGSATSSRGTMDPDGSAQKARGNMDPDGSVDDKARGTMDPNGSVTDSRGTMDPDGKPLVIQQ
jgi:hypothetical protein